MQQKTSASSKNRILSRLSAADTALLKRDLEPVELPLRYVLEVPNKPIKHSYFFEYGLASIIATNGHKRLEVGFGSEFIIMDNGEPLSRMAQPL